MRKSCVRPIEPSGARPGAERLAALVALSGVPYEEYAEHAARILATFEGLERLERKGAK
ncbi:hypothetical protein [Streptosporangium nondiastaticum]|uniref:hypothetical protein n=1 Tax=Streptosporangium nondiastaticum TaxID=35764 RepID=UPI001673157B|nr:hypothetical protein [Streptosporangium nondiastaticum]